MKKRIYLDYNASAPLCPLARASMYAVLERQDCALNASAIHSFGREGRKIVEDARQNLSQLIGAPPAQIIFNSGATEGNNTILRYFRDTFPDDRIAVSAGDHPSVTHGIKALDLIPLTREGVLDLNALEDLFKKGARISLVSAALCNNETGIIQDVSELSNLCQKHGAFLHCDATQAIGRIPVDLNSMGIDFITFSSHKIGGPQGVGAMAMRLCGHTPALLFGGGQEKNARAGTENVAGIAGFGTATLFAKENMPVYETLAQWRDEMEATLLQISPELIIHGKNQNRIGNTSFFSLPHVNAQTLLMAFDLEGIAISNGSACSSGSVKPSATLHAMGYDDSIAAAALRISSGWATQKSDLDGFVNAWEKIYKRIKNH